MTFSPFHDLEAGQSTAVAGADYSVKMVEELPDSTFRVVGQNIFGKSTLHHLTVKYAKDSTNFLTRIYDALFNQPSWDYKSRYLCPALIRLQVGNARMVPMNGGPNANLPPTWYNVTLQDYMQIKERSRVIDQGNVLPQAVDSSSQYEHLKVTHIQGLTTDGLQDVLVIRQVIARKGFFALAVLAIALVVGIVVYVSMKKAEY